MRKLETSRRIIRLFLALLGLAAQVAGFAFIWFKYYKPMMVARQLQFWIKGDILLIVIYAVMLILVSRMYGGLRIGYMKPLDVFLSQAISTLGTDLLAYSILSLMYTKLILYVGPIGGLVGGQLLWIAVWTAVSHLIYLGLFPPRDRRELRRRQPGPGDRRLRRQS